MGLGSSQETTFTPGAQTQLGAQAQQMLAAQAQAAQGQMGDLSRLAAGDLNLTPQDRYLAEQVQRTTGDMARMQAEQDMQMVMRQLEEQGIPVLDHLETLPLDRPADRVVQAKTAFDGLASGLTHFYIHPARDTPELRAITPDSWQSRVADYEAFMSRGLRDHLRHIGVHVIGYRALRGLIRAN